MTNHRKTNLGRETLKVLQDAGWEVGPLVAGPGRVGHSLRIGRLVGCGVERGFEYRDAWGPTPEITYLRAQEMALGEEPGTRCSEAYDEIAEEAERAFAREERAIAEERYAEELQRRHDA